MRNFLASSKGDLQGVDFIYALKRYDRLIQAVQKGLQQAGVLDYGKCRRYQRLVERVRGFLKTNVHRWLRTILEARRPRVVVIEALAFAGQKGDLSRTMNRLLRTFGQGELARLPAFFSKYGLPSTGR